MDGQDLKSRRGIVPSNLGRSSKREWWRMAPADGGVGHTSMAVHHGSSLEKGVFDASRCGVRCGAA
jgi:hypothetical protein